MAQGIIHSEETRNHMTGLLWRNMGDLEWDISNLQDEVQQALTYIDEVVPNLPEQVNEIRTRFYGELIQAGMKKLNGPNLIKQPQYTSRAYPSSSGRRRYRGRRHADLHCYGREHYQFVCSARRGHQ